MNKPKRTTISFRIGTIKLRVRNTFSDTPLCIGEQNGRKRSCTIDGSVIDSLIEKIQCTLFEAIEECLLDKSFILINEEGFFELKK